MTNIYNIVIFPVIFFFLHTSPSLILSQEQLPIENEKEIFLIKQRWHTAIVFNTTDLDSINFPQIYDFREYRMIDIGWGDEAFYQYPGFDVELAFNALFFATPSTLRVEGISISKEDYFDLSEIVIQIPISEIQLSIILQKIYHTFYKIDNKTVLLSEQAGGQIKFYKANGEYHLFNTCNTWLAGILKEAGLEMEDNIILTEQLFNEASKIGYVLKTDD